MNRDLKRKPESFLENKSIKALKSSETDSQIDLKELETESWLKVPRTEVLLGLLENHDYITFTAYTVMYPVVCCNFFSN